MKKWIAVCLAVIFALGACQRAAETPASSEDEKDPGMEERHNAPIPGEYAGLENPVSADAASLERGEEVYATFCASCHGSGGMGDGPAGATTAPPASPIAQTSQGLSDGYLFWRVSEGGAPFQTAMPSWIGALSEQKRWDVINYVRSLGKAGE